MKVIKNVYGLIKSLNKNENKIYLCSNLYDWLLCSSWDCVLGDKLKKYSKEHEVIRIEE